MEFPSCGVRCSTKDCQQLDFLPFTCTHCSHVFCKEHFHALSHSCSQVLDNVASGTEKTATFGCSDEGCKNRSPLEMPCVKCKKHFCLSHRYHGCLELSEEAKSKELENWQKPKREFLEAKTAVDREVASKLRNSKRTSTANKVQLMRIKGKSVGPNSVPLADRRYFLVHPPITSPIKAFEGSKGAFVSMNWNVGKIIDSIADSLKISNSNNVATAKKLRIFNYHTGDIVTNQMDVVLSDLLQSDTLIDGQDVIFEYSTDDKIDNSLYK